MMLVMVVYIVYDGVGDCSMLMKVMSVMMVKVLLLLY